MKPKNRQNKLHRNTAFAAKRHTATGNVFAKIVGLLAVVALVIGVSWGAKAIFAVQSTLQDTYHANGKVSQKIAQQKPISILLLGVDTGAEGRTERGNSDTMIVATINPKTKKATLTSIPRDLLTEIQGTKDFYVSKINAAYNVGLVPAARKTVSKTLNIPIDYYVTVDMQALENLVDAVGGIDVNVPFDFTWQTTFKKGKMHLSGKQALDYARMRYDDPQGDYGRQVRQREVISQIVKTAASLDSVSNYQKILAVAAKYVKTDLSSNDLLDLAMNYRDSADSISSDFIQGHDAWIGDGSYQVASTKELQRVSNKIRKSLGLKKEKLNNEITRQNSLQYDLDWDNPEAFYNYTIYDEFSDTMPWEG